MFSYNKNTEVNIVFDIPELLKTIKADKIIKQEIKSVNSVILKNVLSNKTTNYESNSMVKEIYVIDFDLNTSIIPQHFLETFNKNINLQTLFRLHFKDNIQYYITIKEIIDDKLKILDTYTTTWQKYNLQENPITNKLENVFKGMIGYVTSYSFRENEDFNEYIERINDIKRLNKEIDKQTKTMNAEKQPNLKMELNDKLKLLKKELEEKLC